MTPSRMMTRQKVHPQARACLAAAVAVACPTNVPRPAHADLVLGTVETFHSHAADARGLLGPARKPVAAEGGRLPRRRLSLPLGPGRPAA